jgi:hypothetical protein
MNDAGQFYLLILLPALPQWLLRRFPEFPR